MKRNRTTWSSQYSARSIIEETRQHAAWKRLSVWLNNPNVPRELKQKLWKGKTGKGWRFIRCCCVGCKNIAYPKYVAEWIKDDNTSGGWYGLCTDCSLEAASSTERQDFFCHAAEKLIKDTLEECR